MKSHRHDEVEKRSSIWPLDMVSVLLLALVLAVGLFLTMELWLPHPFVH